MTDDELNQIEARAKAATPGLHRVNRCDLHSGVISYQIQADTRKHNDVLGSADDADNLRAKQDATLWAHAQVDVTALVAEVRRLRVERDAADSQVHRLTVICEAERDAARAEVARLRAAVEGMVVMALDGIQEVLP